MVSGVFEKKHAFVLMLLSVLLALLFAAISGIDKESLLSFSLILGTNASEGSSVSITLLLLASILFPLAYAASAVYGVTSYNRGAKDPWIAAAIPVPLVLYFAGISAPSLVFSAGLVFSVAYAFRSAFYDKEHYKKVDAAAIAKSAASAGLFILSAAAAFSVFFTLYSDPAYSQSQIDSVLKAFSGMGLEDINNMTSVAAEQQRRASYSWIESMEQSVQDAIFLNLDGMAPDQRAACESAVSTRISEIDRSAKRDIDQKLQGASFEGGGFDAAAISMITGLLVTWYPAVVALSVFAAAEFFRTLVLAPLAWLYAWILWRAFGQDKEVQA